MAFQIAGLRFNCVERFKKGYKDAADFCRKAHKKFIAAGAALKLGGTGDNSVGKEDGVGLVFEGYGILDHEGPAFENAPDAFHFCTAEVALGKEIAGEKVGEGFGVVLVRFLGAEVDHLKA